MAQTSMTPQLADDVAGAARSGLERILTRFVVGARLSSALVGVAVAVLGLAAPAQPVLVGATVAGLAFWSVVFAVRVRAHGPDPALIAVDIVIVIALCLSRDHLLPAQALQASAGTGWVDVVAGAGVCGAQWGLRQPAGLLAALAIAVAWAIGTPGAWEAPVVLIVTGLLASGMTFLLRRAAAGQDRLQVEEVASRRRIAAQAAARADERDQQRRLHDTVLATLTMVSTGSIGSDSQTLSRRAQDDRAVIEALRSGPPVRDRAAPECTERLDRRLRSALAARRVDPGELVLTLDLAAIEVPAGVAEAFTDSVLEALTNVARHARTARAEVSAHRSQQQVRVRVRDGGVGFDPDTVPDHRRGLRESIHGRMRALGGDARTTSGQGTGTTIEMWWPGE